jgi:hypothetical protein
MKRGILSVWTLLGLLGTVTAFGVEAPVGKVVSMQGKVVARVEGTIAGLARLRYLKSGDPVYKKDLINTSSDGSVKILFNDESIMDVGPSSLFKVAQFDSAADSKDRRVEMGLEYGKVRASVNQKLGPRGKFILRTRAATMGVRGTEFYVMSDILGTPGGQPDPEQPKSEPVKTQVVVTEGKVEVAKTVPPSAGQKEREAAKPVEVNPGEKVTAVVETAAQKKGEAPQGPPEVSEPPKIEKITPEEIKTVEAEVKLKDATFAKAIVVEPEAEQGQSGLPQVQGGTGSGVGGETLSAIQDMMAKSPGNIEVPKAGELGIPGSFQAQPGFNGNFLPGFNRPMAKLKVIFNR